MTGHWESMNKSSSFTIDLTQSGSHVSGKYCFITNYGNRIDCTEKDDEYNIKGDIRNGVAKVHFNSTFGYSGVATAIIKNNYLILTIDDNAPFVQASMSVPNKLELKAK